MRFFFFSFFFFKVLTLKGQQLHFISPAKGHIVTVRYGWEFNPGAVDIFKLLQELFIVWCSSMEYPFSRNL